MRTFNSHSDVIDTWNTFKEFSSETGIGYEAVRAMHRRNSISPDHWPAVIKAAAARGISGITIEKLAELRATNRSTNTSNLPAAKPIVIEETGGNCS